MPPFYDIYSISNSRNKETIESFLSFYYNRQNIESTEGQEIYIYANAKYNIIEQSIPISTLSELIDYGIENRNHGFCFYLPRNELNDFDIEQCILKFTFDNRIIFGISIEENGITAKLQYEKAMKLEETLKSLTESFDSSIQIENAPADDLDEFEYEKKYWNDYLNKRNHSFSILSRIKRIFKISTKSTCL